MSLMCHILDRVPASRVLADWHPLPYSFSSGVNFQISAAETEAGSDDYHRRPRATRANHLRHRLPGAPIVPTGGRAATPPGRMVVKYPGDETLHPKCPAKVPNQLRSPPIRRLGFR